MPNAAYPITSLVAVGVPRFATTFVTSFLYKSFDNGTLYRAGVLWLRDGMVSWLSGGNAPTQFHGRWQMQMRETAIEQIVVSFVDEANLVTTTFPASDGGWEGRDDDGRFCTLLPLDDYRWDLQQHRLVRVASWAKSFHAWTAEPPESQ